MTTELKSMFRLVLIGFVVIGFAQLSVAQGLGSKNADWAAHSLAPKKKSFSQSFTDSVKGGFDKFTNMLTPPSSPKPAENEHDESSVFNKNKPGPGLYTAVAAMHVQSGRYAEAETNYQKSLALDPNHLKALMGYAKLKEKQSKLDGAVKLYETAAKAYPSNSSVLNNLGLCLARKRDYQKSLAVLRQAIRLQPRRALYRNNIATVLVEVGRTEEALAHLKEAHDESVAYYNVGYLLQTKQKPASAAKYFSTALMKNPHLEEARAALDQLGWPHNNGAQPQISDRRMRSVPSQTPKSHPDYAIPSPPTYKQKPFNAVRTPPIPKYGNSVPQQSNVKTRRPQSQKRDFFAPATHRRPPVPTPVLGQPATTKQPTPPTRFTAPLPTPAPKPTWNRTPTGRRPAPLPPVNSTSTQRYGQQNQRPQIAPLPPIGQTSIQRR